MIKINLPAILESEGKPSYYLTVFKDTIFLVRVFTLSSTERDDLSIFYFSPKLSMWQEVYSISIPQYNQDSSTEQENITLESLYSGGLKNHNQDASAAYIRATILPGSSNIPERLYIYIYTPKTEQLIYTDNGELFYLDESISDSLTTVLSSKDFLIYHNIIYTLFAPSTTQKVKDDSQLNIKNNEINKIIPLHTIFSSNFKSIIGNQVISSFSIFENSLYIAAINLDKGFQLWKANLSDMSGTNLDWQPVIADGAYRYVLNQQISKMVTFRGNLYLATGLRSEHGQPQENEFYPAGFEIIRLYPDDDWDIIIGTPKFTKDGLKVPLSAKGPGFDDPYLTRVECFTIHDEHLYLATQNLDALQIWRSKEGEDWEALVLNDDLSRYRDLELLNIFSTTWGLILAVSTYNTDTSRQLEIWLNK